MVLLLLECWWPPATDFIGLSCQGASQFPTFFDCSSKESFMSGCPVCQRKVYPLFNILSSEDELDYHSLVDTTQQLWAPLQCGCQVATEEWFVVQELCIGGGRAMLRPTCFSVYSQRYAFISSPMNKWTSTSRQELMANLGIRVIIGMVDVPSYREYWLANHVLCHELIAKVMTISPMCGKELHSCKTGCGNDQLSTPSITHSLL